MKTKRAGIFIGLLVLAVAALFLWSRVRGFLEGEEFRRLVEEFAGGIEGSLDPCGKSAR
jgi:hypothetical protein